MACVLASVLQRSGPNGDRERQRDGYIDRYGYRYTYWGQQV